MKKTKSPGFYFDPSYDTKERFLSYWHQIQEIINLKPKKVLEIGVGNGFVSEYLKKRKTNVVTLDSNRRLKPDVVGNVLKMPLKDRSFDVVACFETLEHLPYKNFSQALSEIFRVSQSYAILSLPDVSRVYRFSFPIPKIGYFEKLISLPRLKKQVHKFDGQHYWEIGKAGYPLSRIIGDIEKSGFKVKKTYRVFGNPSHRFFVLKK